MAIEERLITMPGQWAKGAQTNIPTPPVPGIAYRNADLTAADIESGQAYDKVYDSARYNQLDFLTSGLVQGLEQYGILPWSSLTNYQVGGICMGLDGVLYQALQASGPDNGGTQPTSNPNFWIKAIRNPFVYPSAFGSFYEQIPLRGWRVRNGAVFENADSAFPMLWEYLRRAENAWKCKTLAEWNALSAAAGNVGGVPYFVLDASARTIKLPDSRGDYERSSGFNGLAVGGWHQDSIQTGITRVNSHAIPGWPVADVTGNVSLSRADQSAVTTGSGSLSAYIWTVLQRQNNVETRTRAIGMLPCVYVGDE